MAVNDWKPKVFWCLTPVSVNTDFTNLHFFDRAQLRDWFLPTFQKGDFQGPGAGRYLIPVHPQSSRSTGRGFPDLYLPCSLNGEG